MSGLPQKIVIIGPPGSGKSTLAKQLGKILNLPVHHLDKYLFKANWEMVPMPQYLNTIDDLCNEEKWIMDGTHPFSLYRRMYHADLIIFLDFPFPLYVYRVLKRRFVNRGKTRDCMAQGCVEKFTFSFWLNLLRFPFLQRPYIFKLQRLSTIVDKPFFVLKKPKQVNELIEKAAQGQWELKTSMNELG